MTKSFLKGMVFLFFCAGTSASAQMLTTEDVVAVSVKQLDSLAVDKNVFILEITILDGWHINSHQPLDEFLIPLDLEFSDSTLFTQLKTTYPPVEEVTLSISDSPLSVYEGMIEVCIEAEFITGKPEKEIKGNVLFQPCNNEICLSPAAIPFSLPAR